MNKQTPTTEFDTFDEQNLAQQTSQQPNSAKKWDKILNVLLAVVLVVLVVTVVVKAFFVTNVVVSGDSMYPTYTSGNVVKVDRTANKDTIQRGDIVVFYLNNPGWLRKHFDFLPKGDDAQSQYRLLIKRVVAVQGDQIWVEMVGNKYKVMVKTADGNVVGEWYTVPDEPTESETILPESAFYISAHALKRLENYTKDTPYTIPQGYFFAMGDNRDQSHDSRYQDMGDIPYQNLFGEVM